MLLVAGRVGLGAEVSGPSRRRVAQKPMPAQIYIERERDETLLSFREKIALHGWWTRVWQRSSPQFLKQSLPLGLHVFYSYFIYKHHVRPELGWTWLDWLTKSNNIDLYDLAQMLLICHLLKFI